MSKSVVFEAVSYNLTVYEVFPSLSAGAIVTGLAVAVPSVPPFGVTVMNPPCVVVVPLLNSPDTITGV